MNYEVPRHAAYGARRRRPPPCPPALAPDLVCAIVARVTAEMLALLGERVPLRHDGGATLSHRRQIAMYVCHVTLGLSHEAVGKGFGRDRSTVGYACHRIEDRRDDPEFDAFLTRLERIAAAAFAVEEGLDG
jgi:ATPase involved in DNA replication initiation